MNNNTINLCTYFDSNYLFQGIALYQSLCKHTDNRFILWILCLDQRTYDTLNKLNLTQVLLIHMNDFESDDSKLKDTKFTRSKVEYYWTCTPGLPLYIFRNFAYVKEIIYVDADIYFFDSAQKIFDILNNGSILIIPHDYSVEYLAHKSAGKYNVGIMMFRSDENGLKCLNWWREKCIEWCYWRYEDDKIGDQAYLDDWLERFNGVVVSQNFGINAAPWNISKYLLGFDEYANLLLSGERLICYHFHNTHFCLSRFTFLCGYQVRLSQYILSSIYKPYLKHLLVIENELLSFGINIKIPKSGIPWIYILRQLIRKKTPKNFMWINKQS